jgi:hypothetical protein
LLLNPTEADLRAANNKSFSRRKRTKIFPEFQLGILNGWIPHLLYFIGLILCVAQYTNESRIWLFNKPKDESKRVLVFIRLCGLLAVYPDWKFTLANPGLHVKADRQYKQSPWA